MSATGIALDLRYALDPAAWASEVLGMSLDSWQVDVVRCLARRVALCCFRQAGKSTATAVKAAHHVVFEDGAFVVIVAPAGRQSLELRSRILTAIERGGVRELSSNEETGVHFSNGARLLMVPATDATGRGFSGVTLLICEEAAYVDDAVLAAVTPFLDAKNGQLVKLSTANGKRGHFFRSMQDPYYARFTVAWWPGCRTSAETVAAYEREHGSWKKQQEYGCEFLDPEFSMLSGGVLENSIDSDFGGLDV